MTLREELEAEGNRLIRGIRASRTENNGYNMKVSKYALKRRIEDHKRKRKLRDAKVQGT